MAVTAIFILAVAKTAWDIYRYPVTRQREIDAVHSALARIPNVRVMNVTEYGRQATDCISARLLIGGADEISLTGLSMEALSDVDALFLTSIGPYEIRTREFSSEGREGFGWAINIGPSGVLPQPVGATLTNVQSVISHYDAILAALSGWPTTTNNWPTRAEEIRRNDAEGRECFVSLRVCDHE